MNREVQIYLASGSPRRRQLLAQIGVCYEPVAVAVDEAVLVGEDPEAYVTRLALAKARRGRMELAGRPLRPVLGADTAVILGGMILGKPRDRDEGLAMLECLSGRWHRVLSAVALAGEEREAARCQENSVKLRVLSRAERQAYWNTGEPADKAGGYAIQGLAASFIAELRGSYSGVMGLPLFETAELLRDFDIQVL